MDRGWHPPLRSVSSAAALSSSSSPYRWSPAPLTPTSRPQTPASSASGAVAASPISQSGADQDVETLYSHPNIKIVAFTCGGQENAPGTLAWTSPLERSIAVGGFTIYRAPASVAFINCGSALQPILRKSQCWCVDEASTRFVLQIRRLTFWRIELPAPGDGQDDEGARSRELRRVLDGILLFEKTPCPFARSFTIDLPEMPAIRLVPWVPRPPTPQAASQHPSPVSWWAHRRLTESAADFVARDRTCLLRSSPEPGVSSGLVRKRRQHDEDSDAHAAVESAPGPTQEPSGNKSATGNGMMVEEEDTGAGDDVISPPKQRPGVTSAGPGIRGAESSPLTGDDNGENTAVTRSTDASGDGISLGAPPPPSTLLSPLRPDPAPAKFRSLSAARSIEQLRRLPMAIISRAVGVVLHPPRTLYSLMLRVAAKISAGEWSGVAYGVGEDGEHIPVQWDYSDIAANADAQASETSDDEMPVPGAFGKRRSRSFAGGEARQDSRRWDVD